ncbi:MAG TPA: hypothetical protein DCX12_02490 [Chloroflexi bacterium]|nr:hypothetical protein [Chloroflexota bacterium]HBV94967.1 hypothetical protein [Chloroflexota bacterium]
MTAMNRPSATGRTSRSSVAELEADPSAEQSRGAGWGAWFLLVVGVIGLGISVYLTTLHYAGVAPLCSSGGFVNCEGVLKSQYSVVPGTTIPVTVPGMVWFIVSAALALVSIRCARQGSAEPRWLRPGHLIWALLGLASVLYFVYDELVQLHELCEWCTSVHVLVFLSLLVTLGRLQSGGTAAYEGTG